MTAFTGAFGQISPILPYVLTAPFYFAEKIQLGEMTQTLVDSWIASGGVVSRITVKTDVILRDSSEIFGLIVVGPDRGSIARGKSSHSPWAYLPLWREIVRLKVS